MIEFIVTFFASMGALWIKRDSLTLTLVTAWMVSLFAGIYITASYLPGIASMVDMAIAITALLLWTEHGSQRARLVGAISLIKICGHFGVSANFGNGDWTLYALVINSLFVVQCLIAGGAVNGLGNFFDRISPRYRDSNNIVHTKGKS